MMDAPTAYALLFGFGLLVTFGLYGVLAFVAFLVLAQIIN